MKHSLRLLDELRAVGYEARGFLNGAPVVEEVGNAKLFDAVLDSHVPDDAEYLKTDLMTRAKPVMECLWGRMSKWRAYLDIQTKLIQARRRQHIEGPDGANVTLLEALSDGVELHKAQAAMVARKKEAQELYPWPGKYHPRDPIPTDEPATQQAPEDRPKKAKKKGR